MKIITKKKLDRILKRLAENEIIGIEHIYDSNKYVKFVENIDDIAVDLCGNIGIHMLQKHMENISNETVSDADNFDVRR